MSAFLFDSFAADESGFVTAVIGGGDKINTSVNTYNIADVRKAAFFDIICYWYMQKVLSMFIYKLGSAESVDCMVEVSGHTFREVWKFHAAIKRIYRKAVLA